MAIDKNKLIEEARRHVSGLVKDLGESIEIFQAEIDESKRRIPRLSGPDQELEVKLYYHRIGVVERQTLLRDNPYFFRCDARLEGHDIDRTIYISKHAYPEKNVYSWTAPVAALRFEEVGQAIFKNAKGDSRQAYVSRKDNYTMAGGNITSMTFEDEDNPRTLVFQDKITNRKTGFVLPEIVAEMEKAQDKVIRAPYKGSFLIAGPAGSGKTTLALHRVAFLNQSPDTSEAFPAEDIIVFVQDESAKSYFSALLPDLGIHGVTITTFFEWAMGVLGLQSGWSSRASFEDERDEDEMMFAKGLALDDLAASSVVWSAARPHGVLKKAYAGFLSPEQMKKLNSQEEDRTLDRMDLTLLLRVKAQKFGAVKKEVEYYDRVVEGKLTKKRSEVKVDYAMVVIDEAENWTPHEIGVLRSCVRPETEAVVYVGDLSQRTRIGTLKNWDEVGEDFSGDRKATLDKVYRNTRNILDYVRSRGFAIEVPVQLREGAPVESLNITTGQAEQKIAEVAETLKAGETLGVIAKSAFSLRGYVEKFSCDDRIRFMSAEQAQGVEFEKVILLNERDFLSEPQEYRDETVRGERKRVNRDLLYVALTRAMSELTVIEVMD